MNTHNQRGKTIIIKVSLPIHLAKFLSMFSIKNGVKFYNSLEEFALKMECYLTTQQEANNFTKQALENMVEVSIHVRPSIAKLDKDKLNSVITNLIQKLFARSLQDWIFAVKTVYPNTKIKIIITSFLEFYKIDEDNYSFEAAKMIWQRYLEKQNNELIE